MGVVFLAVAEGDAGFTKLRVVKRLRSELSLDRDAVSMFLAEAKLAAKLHHPNVVQTNEVGFDGPDPFLEMEYLEGQSLDAVRRRFASSQRTLPVALSVWIVAQVLAGLDYAHELPDRDGRPLGLVHRDVSPHNVMLTYDGGVKLLDFGIAKVVDSSLETGSGVVKGKATYMAPEQAARDPVDRRADLFAVGVMLCEAVTGSRYWGDRNEFEIFLALRDRALPDVPPEPQELAAICRRALAYSPADRYPSAAAMLADVDSYLAAHASAVGPRALADLMTEEFDATRKSTRAEIDARLRGDQTLRSAEPRPPMVTAEPDGTKVRQRSEIRGLRRIATAALALAVVASAAVSIVVVRSRARAVGKAAEVTPPTGCASNAACSIALGHPAACRRRDGACIAVESDECKLFAEPGELESGRALVVGAMFPLSGPQAKPIGEPSMRAVDLARRDFVEVARGLPSSSGESQPRPVVVVGCDDTADSAKVARHLVTDLEVTAVVGFGSSNDLIDLATSLFFPNHVLTVAAKNSSALITAIPEPPGEPRLLLRTSLSSAAVAAPVRALVSEVLEPARRLAIRGDTRPLRVALLRRNSASGLAVGDALFGALVFNGKSALANGDAFREISISEPSDPKGGESYAQAARELLQFVPDIVVYAGADELTTPLFSPLEAGWPKGAPRPLYVALNSLAGAGASFFSWLGRDADRRRRFVGIAAPASTPTNARFTMRYNQTYAEKVTTSLSPAAPYDAFYLVAYAAIAAGDPASGSDLARGVSRLTPPGKRIEVGPTSIFDAVATLRAGQNIDLHGAGGPLDFDATSGESSADCVFVCPGVDDRGGATVEVESGLSYASAEHALRGALHCP
jgi:ABC-type branched-subunit amino acid transport system substrate-binding protein